MKVSQVADRVCLVEYPNNYLLAMTFMRIQEFYECPIPGFRGHYFTVEEFMDAYAKEYGVFDYPKWDGFNVPGNVVRDFFDTFHDLGTKETRLHEAVQPMIEQFGDQFYLIGTVENATDILLHESAHAFYYLDPDYRQTMDEMTEEWEHSEAFGKALIAKGYCKDVIPDETQAYLATSEDEYLVKKLKFEHPRPRRYADVFLLRLKDRSERQ